MNHHNLSAISPAAYNAKCAVAVLEMKMSSHIRIMIDSKTRLKARLRNVDLVTQSLPNTRRPFHSPPFK